MTDFNHPAGGSTSFGTSRQIGLDVTRAVALIGVVVMNFHGTLDDWRIANDFWHRVFNIYTGALSTRFAATFVVVAGIGTALLSRKAFGANRDVAKHDLARLRLRLVRRGALLLFGGYLLNHAWPGTILFYYGVYFMLSAIFIMWKSRSIIFVALATALSATAIATWEASRQKDGHSTNWLHPRSIDSISDLILRIFVDYTHPVFPWLAFFCIGIVMGRNLEIVKTKRRAILLLCCALIVLCYSVSAILDHFDLRANEIVYRLTSLHPYNRSLLYTVSTTAIAVIAFVVISQLAEKHQHRKIVVHLQRSGQLTLSLYLLHVLVFYIFVDWAHLISSSGLDTALIFATGFWVFAITIASWWQHHFGQGPVERLYRAIGG
ncbi:MAG: DUF418 domain-containing protein [Actinomycetota bacterium]|nr:DUF418 domain-containing protein [Actinomycetota bacterium]MDA3020253.1 DUF418 domain-containing protein [Actinomycetota bacterium]